MGKRPYIEFYTGDYLRDPKLGMCSPLARGVWMDALCSMHEAGGSGQLRGTYEQFARILRSSEIEVKQAFMELKATETAQIEEHSNGLVTLINRRMQREHFERENVRNRVLKHRSNTDVTAENGNCNTEKPDSVTDDVTAKKPECHKPSIPPLASPSLSPASSSSSISKEVKNLSDRKLIEPPAPRQSSPQAGTGSRLPPLSTFQGNYSGKPLNQSASLVSSDDKNGEKAAKDSTSSPQASPGQAGDGIKGHLSPLYRAWIGSGKNSEEYDKLTSPPLPALTHDNRDCLKLAGVEIEKKQEWHIRRGKALIGESRFSMLCHEVKNLKMEGKRAKVNDTARFVKFLENEVRK